MIALDYNNQNTSPMERPSIHSPYPAIHLFVFQLHNTYLTLCAQFRPLINDKFDFPVDFIHFYEGKNKCHY